MSATVRGAACASVIAIGRTGHEMPLAAEARHEDYWHRSRRDRRLHSVHPIGALQHFQKIVLSYIFSPQSDVWKRKQER